MALRMPAGYSNLIALCPLNIPIRPHLCISGLQAEVWCDLIRTYITVVKFAYHSSGRGAEGIEIFRFV